MEKAVEMFEADRYIDPLSTVHHVARFGWLPAMLPIALGWLTIRAEIDNSRRETKGVPDAVAVDVAETARKFLVLRWISGL